MEFAQQRQYVAEAFSRLDAEKKQKFLDALYLLARYPEFGTAIIAAIPPGADAPPWNLVDALIAEWMAKDHFYCKL